MRRILGVVMGAVVMLFPMSVVDAQDASGEQSYVIETERVLDIDPFMTIFEATSDGGFIAAQPCRQDTVLCIDRYDSAGDPVATFGDAGSVVTAEPTFALGGWSQFWPADIDVAADGSIAIFTGCVNWFEGRDQSDMVDVCLFRLGADGSPHPNVPGGVVTYALDRYQAPGGVTINDDGTGWISGYCSSSICIGKLTVTGELDPVWDDGSYFPGLTRARFGEFSMSDGLLPVGDGVWSWGRCQDNPLYPGQGRIREGCLVAFGGTGGVDTSVGTGGHIDFMPSSVVSGGELRVDGAPRIGALDDTTYVAVAPCNGNLDAWDALTCVTRLDATGAHLDQRDGNRFTVLPVDFRDVAIVDDRVMALGRCLQEWYADGRACLVTYDAGDGPLVTPTVLPLEQMATYNTHLVTVGSQSVTALVQCEDEQVCLLSMRASGDAPLGPPATTPPVTTSTPPPETSDAPTTTAVTSADAPATSVITVGESAAPTIPPTTTLAPPVTTAQPSDADTADDDTTAAEAPAEETPATEAAPPPDADDGSSMAVIIVLIVVVVGASGVGIAFARSRRSYHGITDAGSATE